MAGQSVWNDAGTGVNDYVVKEQIAQGVERFATMNSVFGQLNGPRELVTTEIAHKGGTIRLDGGNDSPVFTKPNIENNKALFTLEEPTTGMPTYGDVDVKPGPFLEYMHTECNVRLVSSPAFPIPGFESLKNFERVQAAEKVIESRKGSIVRWQSEEIDLDAFRALFMGASRGILSTHDGGMGITLNGAAAGQHRAPLNTKVAANDFLTPTAWDATTHNANLATELAKLTDSDEHRFSYRTHQNIDYLIGSQLRFKPVTIGGKKYRAVVLIDEWDLHSLRSVDGVLSGLWRDATPRSDENKALYNRGLLPLDGILYVPCEQLRYFRPSVNSSTGEITWGCGMNIDPRSKNYVNDSNITATVVMGAGALLRGYRKDSARFTVEQGRHGKGTEYAYHYNDGWRRHDWYTRDGRQEMANDSSLVLFNYARNPLSV
jgi:hypothetical protein